MESASSAISTFVFWGIALGAVLYGIVIYNNLVNLKHAVSKAWSKCSVVSSECLRRTTSAWAASSAATDFCVSFWEFMKPRLGSWVELSTHYSRVLTKGERYLFANSCV